MTSNETCMRPLLRGLAAFGLAMAMLPGPRIAAAQTVGTSANVGPPFAATSSDAATLQAFGGVEGLRRVADRGVDLLVADPRIAARFQGANLPHLKQRLAEQFCALLGGPCQYSGASMAEAHRGMNIRGADFAALVEDFEKAMDELGIAYVYQTRLLAKLAPMRREVVGQ